VVRGGDVGADTIFGGDVGAEETRRRTQLLCGGMALLVVDVEQCNLTAVGDKMLRHRVAETGGAAGDDCLDLIELHGKSLGMPRKNHHGSRLARTTAG
jgi:hypothetical protein